MDDELEEDRKFLAAQSEGQIANDKTQNFLDAWNELNGGMSSLLGNDTVMDELGKIELDENVSAADALTAMATNVADIGSLLNKELGR